MTKNVRFIMMTLVDFIGANWMSPVQGKSPLVKVKEPYGNFDMVICRLSSCTPECTLYTCR